jgi:branched-chain amino acid transport system ATP-binding protein
MTALLEVENLRVHYGDLVALRGVTLEVAEGETVCVLGPNGAGKSTLFTVIAGGLRPSGGDIRLDGETIVGDRPDQIAERRLSLVPEGRRIFGTLTVEENLKLGGYRLRSEAEAKEEMRSLLELFPRLNERLHYPAGRLSGGEQQMLALARAMMTRPRLLLVDEPSLGLAPMIVDRLYEILLTLQRTRPLTLLINEQSSARITKYANRIYVLREGLIRLQGAARDFTDDHRIRQAYFGFESPAMEQRPDRA